MTRNLTLRYVSLMAFGTRCLVEFVAERRNGTYAIRKVGGETSDFHDLSKAINDRLMRGRGRVMVFMSGWCYYPNSRDLRA